MTSAALIAAGRADEIAAGDEDGGAGDEDGGPGDEADVGGAVDEDGGARGGDGVAGVAAGGAGAAARASDTTSAHAPGKSVAIDGGAGRGTGESYRKSRGASRANYLCRGQ